MADDSPAAAAGIDLSSAPYSISNDIVNVSRPQGADWDMGAYEGAGAGEPVAQEAVYVSMSTGSDTTGVV